MSDDYIIEELRLAMQDGNHKDWDDEEWELFLSFYDRDHTLWTETGD